MFKKLILILLLQSTIFAESIQKKDTSDKLIDAIEFVADLDLDQALLMEILHTGPSAITSLTGREFHNLTTTIGERLGQAGMQNFIEGHSVKLLPNNMRNFIKEALNTKKGYSLSQNGYSEALRLLVETNNYKKCLEDYKAEIKKFLIQYFEKNNINTKYQEKILDNFNLNNHDAIINNIENGLNLLAEYGAIGINPKDFKFELIKHLSENKKTFDDLLIPFVNKKKFTAILLAGAITHIAINKVSMDIFSPESNLLFLSILNSIIPMTDNSSGSYLWRNIFNIKEINIMGIRKTVSLTFLIHNFYSYLSNYMQNISKSSDENNFWYSARILSLPLALFIYSVSIYEEGSDLSKIYNLKKNLEQLKKKLQKQQPQTA